MNKKIITLILYTQQLNGRKTCVNSVTWSILNNKNNNSIQIRQNNISVCISILK